MKAHMRYLAGMLCTAMMMVLMHCASASAQPGEKNGIDAHIRLNPLGAAALYETPSEHARVLDGFTDGEPVQVLAASNGWVKVRVDGKTGFMREQHIHGDLKAAGSKDESAYAVVSNPQPWGRQFLRPEMSMDAEPLGLYHNGVEVDVLDTQEKESWVKVRIGLLVGYIQKQFLAFGNAADGVEDVVPKGTVQNAPAGKLALMEFPDGTAVTLGEYPDGASVEVLGVGPQWHHVRIDGRTGFMRAAYLVLEE